MQTQRGPQGRTTFYEPALSLKITIGQLDNRQLLCQVEAAQGRHTFRRVEWQGHPDPIGALPIAVLNDLFRWTLWLSELDRSGRGQREGQPARMVENPPDWPAQVTHLQFRS